MLLAVAGCVASDVGPINLARSDVPTPTPEYLSDSGDDGSTVVALAFSGGGMRASAFSYGVLTALDDMVVDEAPYRRTMVDNVRMISGVSGGAVVAAYFGHKGRDDYRDLYQRLLMQNAEASMRTNAYSPSTLMRALAGGVNDRSSFARWLDDNLFAGATFAEFRKPNAPTLWINASDIYTYSPFLFSHDTFAALCSDLDAVRISDAVAASSAVPVVFTPVVLDAVSPNCAYEQPQWLQRALAKETPSVRLEAYARTLKEYHLPTGPKYVKLLDGGLTDNLGITGLVLERAASQTPHGPLSAEQAVKLKHMLIIVADAGQEQTANWSETLHGPTIAPLLQAAVRTSMAASVRHEMDSLLYSVRDWQQQLVSYRCALPAHRIKQIRGNLNGWDCRDVKMVVEHLAFTDLGHEQAKRLSSIPTRLGLPKKDIDMLVAAGRAVVETNQPIADALGHVRRRAGVREPVLLAAE
jgi:predicted acylesterase/phospholipase RssA